MRVFVTGATGFTGSAVVAELQRAGHQVIGLACNDEAVSLLTRWGAEAHRGSLQDEKSLTVGAQSCDGVIHLAHDVGGGTISLPDSMNLDRRVIAIFTEALAGSGKFFVGTTGTLVLTPGQVGAEQDTGDLEAAAGFRVPSENDVLAAAKKDIRACVVRLAPSNLKTRESLGWAPVEPSLVEDIGIGFYFTCQSQ